MDKMKHYMCMEKVEILVMRDKFLKQRIKESVDIKRNPDDINRTKDWTLEAHGLVNLNHIVTFYE